KADLGVPHYRQWPLAEGMLNDLILYPLFRALWGQRIRFPAASDFGLSPGLPAALLDEDVCETARASFGVPTCLASYLAVTSWRVAQSALGKKINHLPSFMSQRQHQRWLGQAENQFRARFHDALTVIFSLAHKYQAWWKGVNDIRSLPT